jgi:integrase
VSVCGEQLRLFDLGGLNLTKLGILRDGLRRPVRAPRTITAYASDWKIFSAWCAEAGRPALPATSDTLALYVTWMLTEHNSKCSTAERHVSAVAHFHRDALLPSPVSAEVRAVLSSVRRGRRERPCGKAALAAPDLVRVARLCNARSNIGARDRALVVLGFATSLRRSELAALLLSDVSFEPRGLVVVVRRSKTDQDGKGRLVAVWPGKRTLTDPVRVLRNWIQRRGRWEGPLFSRVLNRWDRVSRKPISGEGINEAIKRAIARAGLDAALYGAHSLRAGAITASADAGRSDQEIMGLSGHENAKVMRGYIRRARVFSGRNPLEGVL